MGRPSTGFGPGAILLSELSAYADIMQIATGDDRQDLMRLVRAMDRSYLDHVSKK